MATAPARIIGRYALHGEIAAGGMATVHFGRLLGPVGFSRTVAIKRLHAQFAKNPEFVSMFLDEARLAARIRHPNVVATLDVVATEGELFLVMDYVQGESLSRLVRASRTRGERIPPQIVATVMSGVLHGLHAAHEARSERGEPLDIVHRDVSPQNVLVGTDGAARVLDFGVAKAAGRIQTTREGHLKGKISYMAPEQFEGTVTRQTDVYAAAIVTWEALTLQRLVAGEDELGILAKALAARFDPPSKLVPDLPRAFDDVVMRGLAADPKDRFQTAREMALALEKCAGVAAPSEVGAWVETYASDILSQRAGKISEIEKSSSGATVAELQNIVSELNKHPGAAAAQEAAAAETVMNPPSQPSTVGVANTRSGPAPGPIRSRRWPIVAGVLAVAGVLGAVALVSPRWSSVAPGGAPSADGEGAVVPPARSASAVATVVAAAASVVAPEETTPAPSASAVPRAPPATRGAPEPRRAPPPKATSAARVRPDKANCDPPFTLDSAGRKKYKLECL